MRSAIQQCLEDELPVQLHLECKRLCCSMPEMSSLTLSSYTVFAVQRQAGQRPVQQSSWQACSNSYSVTEITHSRHFIVRARSSLCVQEAHGHTSSDLQHTPMLGMYSQDQYAA